MMPHYFIFLPLQLSSYKDGESLVRIFLLQSGYLIICQNSALQCCCIKACCSFSFFFFFLFVILLFSTRSVRPWRPAGWRSIRRQVPRLYTVKIREESFYERPHDSGSGGRGPHQGGHTWYVFTWFSYRYHAKNNVRDADDLKWCPCDWLFIQAPEGESQPMTEVDLFISTQRIKVLSADTQVCLTTCTENLLEPFYRLLFAQAPKEDNYSLGH